MDQKSKLMLYLKGWRHGAGSKSIQFQDQPIYLEGYTDGHRAYGEAAEKAQERFGARLSILRTQEPERQ
jgi:hypothetical protein